MTAGAPSTAVHGAVPRLVAHRGYPLHYPENSLAGLCAALAAGASAVECDVQLSADRHAIVIHDANLRRTTGRDGDVRDLDAAALARFDAGEAARFGMRFAGTPIPRLHEVAELAREFPSVTFFLDVKRASLRRFGADAVLDAIGAALDPHASSWVIVSFDRALVEQARSSRGGAVGWVVDTWDDVTGGALQALAPDYAFCAAEHVPPAGPLPAGPWQWVIYGVDAPAPALELGARGAAWIETDAIGELLAAPPWRLPSPSPVP